MGVSDIAEMQERGRAGSLTSDETPVEHAAEVLNAEPKRKWTRYVWDTLDKPKEERWFMFKLDAAILTFASLGMDFAFLRCLILIANGDRVLHQISGSDQYQ
jgi:hypothetical protein